MTTTLKGGKVTLRIEFRFSESESDGISLSFHYETYYILYRPIERIYASQTWPYYYDLLRRQEFQRWTYNTVCPAKLGGAPVCCESLRV